MPTFFDERASQWARRAVPICLLSLVFAAIGFWHALHDGGRLNALFTLIAAGCLTGGLGACAWIQWGPTIRTPWTWTRLAFTGITAGMAMTMAAVYLEPSLGQRLSAMARGDLVFSAMGPVRHEVSFARAQRLFGEVREKAIGLAPGIKFPSRIFLVRSPEVGRLTQSHPGHEQAQITVSTATLAAASDDEVRAGMGHELGHVVLSNQSHRVVTIWMSVLMAFGLPIGLGTLWADQRGWGRSRKRGLRATVGILTAMSWLTLAVLAMQSQLDRQEEFLADAFGARLTSPTAMAAMLAVAQGAGVPAPASDPLDVHGRWAFSDHPSWDERARALGVSVKQACDAAATP